jgi:hypothetical protein
VLMHPKTESQAVLLRTPYRIEDMAALGMG